MIFEFLNSNPTVMMRKTGLKNRIFPYVWIAFFQLLASLSSVFAESNIPKFRIHLRWQSVPGVTRYKIQVGRQKNFKKIIKEDETSGPEWVLDYEMGSLGGKKRIFYRVASMNERGEIGKFSSAHSVLLPERPRQEQIVPKKVSKNVESVQNKVPSVSPDIKTGPSEAKRDPATSLMSTQVESHHDLITRLKWNVGIHTGFGNFNQKSDAADLKSVTTLSRFAQQKFGIQIDLRQSESLDTLQKQWSLGFQIQHALFVGVNDPRPYQQPNVTALSGQLQLVRWASLNSAMHFGYGLILDRSYRWIKSGPESVDAGNAVSVGPSLSLTFTGSGRRFWAPRDAGLLIDAPVSGRWTGGQLALDLVLWSEWKLIRFDRNELGLRFEGSQRYSSWDSPEKTQISMWSFWAAGMYHFGD